MKTHPGMMGRIKPRTPTANRMMPETNRNAFRKATSAISVSSVSAGSAEPTPCLGRGAARVAARQRAAAKRGISWLLMGASPTTGSIGK